MEDSGELTPTLKPRRRVIQRRYDRLIAAMYDAARTARLTRPAAVTR